MALEIGNGVGADDKAAPLNASGQDMVIKPVTFGDEGQVATRELLRRFDAFAGSGREGLRAQLVTLENLDRQYGGSAPIPLEDVEGLAASILAELASLDDPDLVIGVALWAQRHDVEVTGVEPVVNALAQRSNRAGGKQELAAVFGLMQGFIAHVAPRLAADLERSNPERPWRVLHVNFAITAIRTEDPAMIDFAFDALDAALPDERAGFYSEALALALGPAIASGVRERIAARHTQWAANMR